MSPSRVLRIYLAVSLVVGLALCIPLALLIRVGELEANAGLFLCLSWNALFMLVLPLVMDWSESKYFQARFIALEDLALENPELKAYLEKECEKFSLASLKVAVANSPFDDTLSYGLWRQNPRLIIAKSVLQDNQKLFPSIEVELARFARQDISLAFMGFAFVQLLCQVLIVTVI